MDTGRHLSAVAPAGPAGTPAPAPEVPGVAMGEALASFLGHLAGRRGRSGRVTSAQTVRAYTSALPRAFAGIGDVADLTNTPGSAGPAGLDGGERLRANVRDAWGAAAPATFNARRAAVASALRYFAAQGWLEDPDAVLHGLDREHQPRPDSRVRDRARIDRLIADTRRPLADRTLWAMLYATAARAEEVLALDITDLDRPNRRARAVRKGGRPDELLYDIRTARMLGQLLGRRRSGPVFLSTRTAPDDGTVAAADVDPGSRRRRMTYRTAERHLDTATRPTRRDGPAGSAAATGPSGGWNLHDLRHSRLTHAGEDGLTEADLMNLSGHEDRRTLQRYLAPSKERTQQRLDALDTRDATRVGRAAAIPDADELATRLARLASVDRDPSA